MLQGDCQIDIKQSYWRFTWTGVGQFWLIPRALLRQRKTDRTVSISSLTVAWISVRRFPVRSRCSYLNMYIHRKDTNCSPNLFSKTFISQWCFQSCSIFCCVYVRRKYVVHRFSITFIDQFQCHGFFGNNRLTLSLCIIWYFKRFRYVSLFFLLNP